MQNSQSQSQHKLVYGSLSQTINSNWKLSSYARTQKELRLEASKLSKEDQEIHLIQVFNNRPSIHDEEIRPNNKKIVGYDHGSLKFKSSLGVIHPEHQYIDPRIKQHDKKVKEDQWYQIRLDNEQRQSKIRPQTAKTVNDQNQEFKFELQSKKIDIKPPPLLEIEKPFMQDHLVSPYIYIQKLIKKNSEDINMKHPDKWDQSSNGQSLRVNKQINVLQTNLKKKNQINQQNQNQQNQIEKDELVKFNQKQKIQNDRDEKNQLQHEKLMLKEERNQLLYQKVGKNFPEEKQLTFEEQKEKEKDERYQFQDKSLKDKEQDERVQFHQKQQNQKERNQKNRDSEKEQREKEKDERNEFHLVSLRMREFLFKFFKTVNKLLKEKHYSKVMYSGDSENCDLGALFKMWAKHKGISVDAKQNPQYYLTREQFCDFILDIGLYPEKIGDAERFFEYCHQMVASGGQAGKTINDKGVIVPKWWKMFEENKKNDTIEEESKKYSDFY